MAYRHMTAGDLRKALEGLPDDSPVLLKPHDTEEFGSHDRIRRRVNGEVQIIEAKPAKAWNHNTREVYNAYHAHDDRYSQNQVLLLEIGGFSD